MKLSWLKYYDLLIFDTIDSTNKEALRLAQSNITGNLVIIANNQTSTKTNAGKNHSYHPENFNATLLLSNDLNHDFLPANIVFIIANAINNAIKIIAEKFHVTLDVKLKWPNIVLASGKKISEFSFEYTKSENLHYSIVGISLNLKHKPELAENTISLFDLGIKSVDNYQFLDILLKEFHPIYQNWLQKNDFQSIKKKWISNSSYLNQKITIKNPDPNADNLPITGICRGICDTGAMILELNDGTLYNVDILYNLPGVK